MTRTREQCARGGRAGPVRVSQARKPAGPCDSRLGLAGGGDLETGIGIMTRRDEWAGAPAPGSVPGGSPIPGSCRPGPDPSANA